MLPRTVDLTIIVILNWSLVPLVFENVLQLTSPSMNRSTRRIESITILEQESHVRFESCERRDGIFSIIELGADGTEIDRFSDDGRILRDVERYVVCNMANKIISLC